MSEHVLPNKEIVAQITQMATECFKSFGGGQENKGSILGSATKDGPAIFALGVDISKVVTMVLTMAGYQKLVDACNSHAKLEALANSQPALLAACEVIEEKIESGEHLRVDDPEYEDLQAAIKAAKEE